MPDSGTPIVVVDQTLRRFKIEELVRELKLAVSDGDTGECLVPAGACSVLLAEIERLKRIESAARDVLNEELDETDTHERLDDLLNPPLKKVTKKKAGA